MKTFLRKLWNTIPRRHRRPWDNLHKRGIAAGRLDALRRADNGWVVPDKVVEDADQYDELIAALFGMCGPLAEAQRLTGDSFSPAEWHRAAEAWFNALPPVSIAELIEAQITIGRHALATGEAALKTAPSVEKLVEVERRVQSLKQLRTASSQAITKMYEDGNTDSFWARVAGKPGN